MNKRIIISLVVLAVICCLGVFVILAGLYFVSQMPSTGIDSVSGGTPTPSFDNDIPAQPAPLDTPLPVNPHGGEASHPSSDLSNSLADQMNEIQEQVSEIRGLQPLHPINRAVLTTKELEEKVKTEFFKDYSAQDAKDDGLLLSTLGLLPRDYDLINLYTRLYSEQIAGYYDSETKEMYVVQGQTFGGIERMTYAHEYTHTLQDQTYDLQNGLKVNTKNCRVNTEYCAAVTALLEGDAVFTEQQWLFRSSSDTDRADLQAFYTSYASPVFDSAPQYLKDDFMFPYQQGLEFVYSLNDRGSYDLVDKAFKEPPVTTEQIMHPDKYPEEKPLEITLPELKKILVDGWQEVESNILGEWYTYLVLSDGLDAKYQLPKNVARQAAAGWGGDRFAIYVRPADQAVVFLLYTRWDSQADARDFFEDMGKYGQARWGKANGRNGGLHWQQTNNGNVVIQQKGTDTLWLITPDETVQKQILAVLPPFNE
ncbi:MAG: hypothetical protein GYA15_09845 [Leptolinea sp.]|jgi:hypothetical protein|nr:hypothetical protein [Leptolinea sp.]